jgi:hypothetical protein
LIEFGFPGSTPREIASSATPLRGTGTGKGGASTVPLAAGGRGVGAGFGAVRFLAVTGTDEAVVAE